MAIVIPAYKGRFLKETLDSIAVQTHKDEFVLYIGDDASPERLDKIVESYQNKVNLVYHRFSENMGGKDLVAGPLGEVYPAVCRAVYLAFLG